MILKIMTRRMEKEALFIWLLFTVITFCDSVDQHIDIAKSWSLVGVDNPKYFINGLSVPFGVHTALENSNLTSNILTGFHETAQRWITNGSQLWRFVNTFDLPADVQLNKSMIDLELFSIDPFASVFLNDKYIGQTANQFTKTIFKRVNDHLIGGGKNKLEINMKSPIQVAKGLSNVLPYSIPGLCQSGDGECFVNLIRKQQSSFGSTVR